MKKLARVLSRVLSLVVGLGLLTVAPTVRSQSSPIIVDHTNLVKIDQIPSTYIQAAQALRASTIGRSVGWNIDNGLNCLAQSYATAPSSCKSGLDPSLVWSGNYPRPNWTTWYWPGVGLPNPVPAPCANLSNGLWTTYQPVFICFGNERMTSYDVFSFQFDYLTGGWSDSIGNYFTQRAATNDDSYDFETWRSALASGKQAFMWTTSLMKKDDCQGCTGTLQRLNDYNVAARPWAVNHNTPLLDMADIESHDLAGNLCTFNGYPRICDAYTPEASGGHLSATGQTLAATAYWNMLARLVGWPGPTGGDVTPPTIASFSCTKVGDSLSCSANVHDDVAVTNITVTVTAVDAAGHQTTSSAQIQ